MGNVIDGMIDKLNSQKEQLFTNLDENEQQKNEMTMKNVMVRYSIKLLSSA